PDALPIYVGLIVPFAQPHGLEVVHALAGADPAKDMGFLVHPLFWNENGDRLPNHLFFRKPENLLGTLVPACDNAIEVFADDGIIRRLNDARKEGLPAILLILIGHINQVGATARDAVSMVYPHRIDQHPFTASIRSLDNQLGLMGRVFVGHGDEKRMLVFPQNFTVKMISSPRAAPRINTNHGLAAPKLRRRTIVGRNESGLVTGIYRNRRL